MKKFSSIRISLCLIIVSVVFILISFIRIFANFYTDNIYPLLNFIIGCVTAPLHFAIGEIIMYIGAVSLIIFIIFSILFIFLHRKNLFKKIYFAYSKYILLFASIMIFQYTITWIIPFNADVLYVGNPRDNAYTIDEVSALRAYYVNIINEEITQIPRDDNNKIIYGEYQDRVIEAMKSQSSEFPRLRGHYSHYKPALCSDFLEWMRIGGYNYPYTMEPTLNIYCDKMYMPSLYAHELAHHKGYYKENEAEFLSCVALTRSNDPLLRISGAESALYYLEDAYNTALDNKYSYITDKKARLQYIYNEYMQQPQLSDLYYSDKYEVMEEADEFYNENVNESAKENFSEMSEDIAETGWAVQADVLGENIYSGVTLMLLTYFYNNPVSPF